MVWHIARSYLCNVALRLNIEVDLVEVSKVFLPFCGEDTVSSQSAKSKMEASKASE
jgi:hypothetical protein